MQQCMYKTKICDVYDLQKRLTQTWVDSEQNIIEAAIDHYCLRSCVRTGGGKFEHMLWNYCSFVLCGSSEHFMKLSIVHLMAMSSRSGEIAIMVGIF